MPQQTYTTDEANVVATKKDLLHEELGVRLFDQQPMSENEGSPKLLEPRDMSAIKMVDDADVASSPTISVSSSAVKGMVGTD